MNEPPRSAGWQAFRSLSRAMYLGFVRDRAALFFSILFPVLFLVLFGSIYKGSSTPKIHVVEVGRVAVLDEARAGSHGRLDQLLTVTRSRDLAAAVAKVRQGEWTPRCCSAAASWWSATQPPAPLPPAW